MPTALLRRLAGLAAAAAAAPRRVPDLGCSWARSNGPAASFASFCGGKIGCISSLTVGHPEPVTFCVHGERRIHQILDVTSLRERSGNASTPNCGSMLLYLCVIVSSALKSSEVREERI